MIQVYHSGLTVPFQLTERLQLRQLLLELAIQNASGTVFLNDELIGCVADGSWWYDEDAVEAASENEEKKRKAHLLMLLFIDTRYESLSHNVLYSVFKNHGKELLCWIDVIEEECLESLSFQIPEYTYSDVDWFEIMAKAESDKIRSIQQQQHQWSDHDQFFG